jgi:hypothetical protein
VSAIGGLIKISPEYLSGAPATPATLAIPARLG